LKDLSILLVEDNPMNQMVAVDTLSGAIEGCKVDVAENGQVALEKLQSKQYDLMLMDVQMPVMDGYTTTRHIREQFDAPLKNIPIMAMTASAIKSEVEKCFESGMNAYISKPFQTEDLLRKIARLVAT